MRRTGNIRGGTGRLRNTEGLSLDGSAGEIHGKVMVILKKELRKMNYEVRS